ncbi:MAG: dihydrolipoyl dehydrogenase [Thaumarchaeota archaeon]|jgi:dihydrolipoamide dehydrogenase|nr:dihydrolipoyl dehydrogenase [Candidatus Wolframiiraptor allenii]
MIEEFDVIVIGGGPGGYVAGIRLGQRGLKTLLIEKDELGGECLNRGCIPSKTLISRVNIYWSARNARWLSGGDLKVNWSEVQAIRERVIKRLRLGVKYLLEGNGVKVVEGEARLRSDREVEVRLRDGSSKMFRARNIVIATGGEHAPLREIPFDGNKVITSSQALELREIPRRLLIVGGGVSGVEIGTLYAKLGTEVTIVELMDQILPGVERDLVDVVAKKMKKLGVKIYTSSRIVESKVLEDSIMAVVEGRDGGSFEVRADYAMVAVGKKPASMNLGLSEVGVELDKRGFIIVNDRMETSVPGIYAVGDVTGPPFLAHRASYHGMIAAENIAGLDRSARDAVIPFAIFSDPEIAYAGLTEAEARERGIEPRIGKFPFTASGRAVAEEATDGFVKVIADSSTGRVIGCQIVGQHATELISEAVLAIHNGMKVEQFAKCIRPHPTFSEAVMEAAEAALWKPIHMVT